MIISSRVPQSYNNFSLLDYLTSRFTYLSYQQWELRLSEKRIHCNGIICLENLKISSADIISYDLPNFSEPPADLDYRIVYEDPWLLGVDKPGNLLVHKSGKSITSNLIYQLRYVHNPPYNSAGIVTRLDRETSGIVIVGKNREAVRILNALLSSRKLKKEYYCIVHGIPAKKSGRITFPIGRVTNAKIRYRFGINGENAKEAITNFRIIKIIKKKYSFLQLIPETGRTHQLRVHMHALGHTIIGDKLYGRTDDEYLSWQKNPLTFLPDNELPRHALHCAQVNFYHPYLQKQCVICAPLPSDMNLFCK